MNDLLDRIDAAIDGQEDSDSYVLTLDPSTAALARQSLRTALYGGRMPEGGRRLLLALVDALGDESELAGVLNGEEAR